MRRLLATRDKPQQQVDENMRRAHERSAASRTKFFFRSNFGNLSVWENGGTRDSHANGSFKCHNHQQGDLEEMTVLQILDGKVKIGVGCYVANVATTATILTTTTRFECRVDRPWRQQQRCGGHTLPLMPRFRRGNLCQCMTLLGSTRNVPWHFRSTREVVKLRAWW